MKKFIIVLLLLIPINVFGLDLDITSGNAIMYNLNDNEIIYEKNKNEEVSIASLTKIMTCIVALENINNIDDKVTLTYKDFEGLVEQNAAVAGFRVGEEVTYRDLLYGLMLPSGADAAQSIARNIAGGNEEYVELMNKKVKELGLKHTHFVNTTGLDIDGHYSSAEDISKIFMYALKNEAFKEIITTSKYTTSDGSLTFRSTISRALNNYNLDMDYLLGGKTGTTGDAGLCLATIAEKDKVKYLLVTVKAPMGGNIPSSYTDQKKIYEYFMNNYSYKSIVDKDEKLLRIKTKYAKKDYVVINAPKTVKKYLDNDFSQSKVKYKYTGKKVILYNTKKGTKLGKIDIIYEGKILDTIDVYLNKKQELDVFKYISGHKVIIIIPSILLILLIILIIRIKMGKKIKIKRKIVK